MADSGGPHVGDAVGAGAHAVMVSDPSPTEPPTRSQTRPPRYLIVAGILVLVVVGVILAILLRLDRMEGDGADAPQSLGPALGAVQLIDAGA